MKQVVPWNARKDHGKERAVMPRRKATTNPKRRPVTVADLPTSPAYGVMLYCDVCSADYSACAGDYWMMRAGDPFVCGQCRTPLRLVRKVTHYEDLAP